MIAALKGTGYDGWFCIHRPLQHGQRVEAAIRESHAAVAHFIAS